jgi:hypothetical protein
LNPGFADWKKFQICRKKESCLFAAMISPCFHSCIAWFDAGHDDGAEDKRSK